MFNTITATSGDIKTFGHYVNLGTKVVKEADESKFENQGYYVNVFNIRSLNPSYDGCEVYIREQKEPLKLKGVTTDEVAQKLSIVI